MAQDTHPFAARVGALAPRREPSALLWARVDPDTGQRLAQLDGVHHIAEHGLLICEPAGVLRLMAHHPGQPTQWSRGILLVDIGGATLELRPPE